MHLIRAFRQQSHGTIAITSALLMAVIIVMVGAIADFGHAYNIKRRVQASLDAALLAAASDARAMVAASAQGDPDDLMEAHAEEFFRARMNSEGRFTFDNLTFSGARSGNTLSISGSVRLKYDYYLLPLINIDQLDVTVRSGASVSLPTFVAIDFLVDGSGSMGIGATNADQDMIFDAVGCAFACHTRGHSSYANAQTSGGEMRIDVARRAIAESVGIIEDVVDDNERVTLGIHMFSSGPIDTIQLSTANNADNWTQFSNKVNAQVHLADQWTGTNIAYAMDQLAALLPTSGNGTSENDRKRFVIVLSDFVENSQSCTTSSCWFVDPNMTWSTPLRIFAGHERIQPPAATICDSLKAKDITVFAINTTYLVPWGHPVSGHNRNRFEFIEDEVLPLINDRLSACTGDPNHVIEATSVEEIETAIEELVRATVAPLHLYRN